ncbi:MAG: xanthine dehydrogenase family protein molybdopterin-binding subunit [Anaerolineae bacterium]
MGEAVGRTKLRVDGLDKVTGQARFLADLSLGRTTHARVLRATCAHAYIRRLDTSRARTAPGVKAVVTGDDCPGRIGHAIRDQYPIARDKVRYWGEPVAVVVGTSPESAEAALPLIDVEYEMLPALLHPRDAVQEDAPLVHENVGDYLRDSGIHVVPGSNICHHYQLRRGDVDSAFARAHLVVENEYWVPWIAHVQLEPHGAAALWDGDTFTIWSSSQSPFFIRQTISALFGISPSKVRVVIPYVGGGFGGKSDVTIEPLLAVAASAVPGNRVQLLLTREEMFFGTVVGRGVWGRIKTAVDADGYLLAEEVELYFASGGYADYSVWICQGGGHNATGPYYVPDLRLDSYSVYTNTPPTGAYRGYGHPEVHWMVERQMDQIARRLGIPPADLRLKNLLLPGKTNALGQVMQAYNGRADLCLEAVRTALGARSPSSGRRRARGQGIACFMKSPVMRTNAQSGAILRFNEDGSVTLFTGAVEIGQGANTVLSQIAAEALSLPMDLVHYAARVDTDFSPHEWQTVASHTTWAVGNAVRLAAADALRQLKSAASEVLGVPVDNLEARNGLVFPEGQPDQAIPYAALATGYRRPDGSAVNPPVVGRGTFVPKGLTFPDPATGQGNLAASWTFGCQGADVEVDLDTGQIHVLRLVSAQDAGRILNPDAARGQVEGAMIQALGATLMEKLHFGPDGRIQNWSLTDYRIPTSSDVPRLEVIFIETEDATGPFGARGLGEHGIVAIPAAIGNAVADALGVDFFEIPITPQMVMEALETRLEGR